MDVVSKAMFRAKLADVSGPKSNMADEYDEIDSDTRIKLKNAEKERKKEKKKREKQYQKKEEERQKMRQSIRDKYDLDKSRKRTANSGRMQEGKNFAENTDKLANDDSSCVVM